MEPADFIQLVMQDDEQAALTALQHTPELAGARSKQGISVVCLAVYRRYEKLGAALAELRSELDMFEAACVGDLARVKQLASDDPSRIDAVSPDGFSPLGYSAFFGHEALLEELIHRDGAVNTPSTNTMRVCPLHSAAATSDQAKAVRLARRLLEAGADPNAKQQGGYTALHEAAGNGNLALIALLLKHGADAKAVNDQGVSAVEFARTKGQDEAVRALEAAVKP